MPTPHPTWTLDLSAVADVPVRLAGTPMSTAVHLASCAFTPGDRCGRDDLTARIRSSVSAPGAAALSALPHAGDTVIPACLLPSAPGLDPHQWADAVTSAAPTFEEQLTEVHGGRLPSRWRQVARAPKRWLAGYAAACLESYRIVETEVHSGKALAERESVRVGTAVVRGATLDLLTALFEGASRSGHVLRVPAMHGRSLRLSAAGLTLVPVLAGSPFRACGFTGDTVTHLVYPLRPAPAPAPDRRRRDPGAAELGVLLGAQRASILRAVAAPVSAGKLASHLACTPSLVTHHLDALVGAGLVERHRRGRHVFVERTERGAALLELYHTG